MTVSITCHGCGQRLSVPEEYKRRKVQCPECGVFCEVPAPAGKQPLLPKHRVSSDDPGPSALGADDAATELALDLWSGANRPAGPFRQEPPVQSASHDHAPRAEPDFPDTDDDDGSPYRLVAGAERKCPNCSKLLAANASLCPHCGFNLETGKKAIRVYEPLMLRWDAGLPFQGRLALFFIAECVGGALALMAAFALGHPSGAFTSFLVFTIPLAFLLGTFDRLELTRNQRGRVVLTQTWRVLFFPRPTTTIALREYEGVTISLSHDAGLTEWIIFVVLLFYGLIPGLIWWFLAIHQDTYQVALTKDHGYPACILYRGWNQNRAEEIGRTLRDVGGLPLEGGS